MPSSGRLRPHPSPPLPQGRPQCPSGTRTAPPPQPPGIWRRPSLDPSPYAPNSPGPHTKHSSSSDTSWHRVEVRELRLSPPPQPPEPDTPQRPLPQEPLSPPGGRLLPLPLPVPVRGGLPFPSRTQQSWPQQRRRAGEQRSGRMRWAAASRSFPTGEICRMKLTSPPQPPSEHRTSPLPPALVPSNCQKPVRGQPQGKHSPPPRLPLRLPLRML
mmetsp:Transcript_15261/g.30936  ORF Transcript_15261/g.30936 Transcript_15261/m.30936 type:complete len:214 (-) Transcript_15261:412-1053(-)